MIDVQDTIPQLQYCTDSELARLRQAVWQEQAKRQANSTTRSFSINDSVQFTYKNQEHRGTIIRINSKRASVLIAGHKWLVPYSILSKE